MEEFRAIANKHGGSFEPDPSVSAVHEWLHKLRIDHLNSVDQLNAEFRSRGCRGLNLQLGYVVSPIANAFAWKINDADIIGLHLGAAFRIQNAAWALYQAGVLEFCMVNQITKENSKFFDVPYDLNLAKEMSGDFLVKRSENPVAINCINVWINTAIEFALHHETAHIWNGHVDLVQHIGQIEMNDEIQLSSGVDKLRHMLEIDADARAMHVLMLNHFTDNWDIGGGLKLPPNIPAKIWIQFVFVGVYLSFRILYLSDKKFLPIINSATHPPSAYRLSWAILHMASFLHRVGGIEPHETLSHIREIYSILEYVILMTHGSESIDIMDADFWTHSMKVRSEFSSYFVDVIDMLSPHMRGEKIPEVGSLNASDYI